MEPKLPNTANAIIFGKLPLHSTRGFKARNPQKEGSGLTMYDIAMPLFYIRGLHGAFFKGFLLSDLVKFRTSCMRFT